MRNQKFIILFVIGMGILGNLFFHYNNNQYLHDDIKGKYGVVNYENSRQKIHYLTDGWQLYFHEDNIENLDKKVPDEIVDIYQSRDVNQAAYRLQILSDETSESYTFVLPEIFSEYEFYINGKKVYQQEYIQYARVTVPMEKKFDCVLLTRNQNHYYSGQIFPIAFGESSAIDQMQGLQNYSHSALMVISFLSMLIMGCMYIYTGRNKEYLYAFVFSLLLTLYLSHYFVHQFVPVYSIIPYITEDISYVLSLGVLFLFIYQLNMPTKNLNKKWIFILGILMTLCCMISYILPPQMHFLYYISLIIKINMLLLLVYTLYKIRNKTIVYYMIIIFVISYGFDFSYNYEPIYLGWGMEISAILLLVAYNISVIQRQIHLYRTYNILRDKESLMLEYANTKSHDMKAPMATMKGYVELLHDNLDDDDKAYILQKLNEKISLLTSRLTQLQNLDYETCILNKEKTNLKDLLESIVEEFSVQLLKREREIIQELSDISYLVDSHYFSIIIENLLMNAIEHSYQTKIYIRLYNQKQNVIIEIQDFGEMINQEEKNHLFDQGFSTKGSSRGYGLYISRKIIEEHGGKLFVISNEEKGTVFIVSLPL